MGREVTKPGRNNEVEAETSEQGGRAGSLDKGFVWSGGKQGACQRDGIMIRLEIE